MRQIYWNTKTPSKSTTTCNTGANNKRRGNCFAPDGHRNLNSSGGRVSAEIYAPLALPSYLYNLCKGSSVLVTLLPRRSRCLVWRSSAGPLGIDVETYNQDPCCQ